LSKGVFTLFLPGIESASAAALPRMPALERLLARGRARPLDASPWAFLAALAGGDEARWPVGPVSAAGELAAPPRACLRVEPLGAIEHQAAFRLPAARLEISREEADQLAAAFRATFAADGLRLEIAAPERWYLAWADGDGEAAAWRGFAGPARSLLDDERPAPPEAPLRRLSSETELLFHAHPVNAARSARGAPLVAGVHPWGGGALTVAAPMTTEVAAVAEEPYLAGLRRLGLVPGAAARGATKAAVDGDGIAWPLAIETLELRQLARIEQDWGAPLLGMLRRGRLDGVRIVTGRAVHETRRRDALRIWRRPRPVAELC
jgi:hypothetical protein